MDQFKAAYAGSIPIFVTLADLDTYPDDRPHQLAARTYATEAFEPLPGGVGDALGWAIQHGSAVLLLDGLDEVQTAAGVVRAKVASWALQCTRTSIVMTSRRFGYLRPTHDFEELELAPLEPVAQRILLERYIPVDRANDVLEQVLTHPAMQEMAQNPFLLTQMALLAKVQSGPLPTRRLPLYRRLIDEHLPGGLLGRDRAAEPAVAAELRAILGELALSLLQSPGAHWSRSHIEATLRPLEPRFAWLDGRSDPLADLASQTGLLVPLDKEQTRWRFYHRSIMECLAAEALNRRGPKQIKQLARALSGSPGWKFWEQPRPPEVGRWAEVFCHLASLLDSDHPERFIRLLKRDHPTLAERALLGLDHISPETLLVELSGGDGSAQLSLPVLRDLMSRLTDDREALAGFLVRLAGPHSQPGTLHLLAAALLAIGADGQHLARLRKLAPEGDNLGVPQTAWARVGQGTFLMGSPEGKGHGDERPQHQVRISHPFEMLATPVTQALYAVVTGQTPSYFEGDLRRPVETVSWEDAQRFCAQLSALLGREVRLPTEAEWEYGCRAGTPAGQDYWSGDGEESLKSVGWYHENAEQKTHPVATKDENPWDIYDVHGNVWEWTSDLAYRKYKSAPVTDPPGPTGGEGRVMRGGSWILDAGFARAAYRNVRHPTDRGNGLGFRVVLPAPGSRP
ncbi:MAG: SUMF1/EgtB/PvdO family nonheme iron enzyme [Deltaproteobacteria bacterium]|nr:SUMF1/EgtB/PvdO family nonheme iron enzyme [Deltaproteobacteria bacterium]